MTIKVDEVAKALMGVVEEEKKIFNHIIELSETRFDDIIKDRVIEIDSLLKGTLAIEKKKLDILLPQLL